MLTKASKKLRARNKRIYRRWLLGQTQSDLARFYGITRQRVHAIINREALR